MASMADSESRAADELLKVGKTEYWQGRFSEYRGWHLHEGLQVEIDFYPAQSMTPGSLRRLENELRQALRRDGHVLPRDHENIR